MIESRRRPVFKMALLALGVAIAFFAVAVLSLSFTKFAGRIAAIWPANAVLLALVLRNRRAVTLVILAGMVGNFAANFVTGDPLFRAAILSGLNAFEVSICAVALFSTIRGEINLVKPRQLLVFVLVATLAAPFASGVIATVYLHGAWTPTAVATFKTWWISDALGLIIFTPALLVLSDRALLTQSFGRKGAREAVFLCGLLALALAVVFFQSRLPLLYLIPPILGVLTFRLGLAGGAVGLLLTAAVSIAALILGMGPTTLVGGDPEQRVAALQCFLAFVALTTLPMASVLGGRREFERRIQAEKEQAEHAVARLREANALADLAEQMAGVGYWVYRTTTGERTWSKEMFRIYGVPSEEQALELDVAIERYHPDDRALVRLAIDQAIETGEVQQLNLRLDSDGAERRVIACMQLVADGADDARTLLGVLIDVTRLTQAEQALAHSEARFRELSELSPDLILRMSRDGRITYASPSASAYGHSPAQLIGRDLHDLIHPDDEPQARERWARYLSADGLDPVLRREQRILTGGGDWVWLEGNPAQVRGEAGEVVEIIKIFRDMTQRHALEQALTAAREQAELALKVKTEFLANMSHELRTPLSSVLGFSTLLRATSNLPPREANFAARIENASRTLLALVNDILDLSKLEAGGFEFESAPVVLDELVESSLALVAPQAEAKGLVITHGGDGIECFDGDQLRVRQVLVNLLGNAVKFTQRGGIELKVSRDDGFIRFSVRDSGDGIEPSILARIFDRFTQADGASNRQHGGSGLGLAIARGLVEGMGGRIWVESEVGIGSTFSFVLPMRASA